MKLNWKLNLQRLKAYGTAEGIIVFGFLVDLGMKDSNKTRRHTIIHVIVSCTSKIQGGQDYTFLFWDGLVNYKANVDLS
jgi:hypothetical protein